MNTLNSEVNTIECLTACPSCGSEKIKACFDAGDIFYKVSNENFTVSVCQNCKLYFLSRRVVASAVGAYYPFEYSPYNNKISKAVINKESFINKLLFTPVVIINKIVKTLVIGGYNRKWDSFRMPGSSAKSILDFGCGDDSYLNLFKETSRITIGMDFTPTVISKVKESGHIGILYDSEAAWDQIQDSSVDFIRMSHVVEHLYDPSNVFSKLYQKMKPGGLLHILVPNPEGISARIFGKYFLAFADLPRHVMMFPLKGLMRLLESKHFEVVDTLQEIVTKDFVRSIFIKKNYRSVDTNAMHAEVNNVKFNELLFTPMALAALFSKSDRYQILVRKGKI
jgi:2-polyprenyl-3-methyl-5-hydroxy-6-metoxy-1,4-benzoquinol methylase